MPNLMASMELMAISGYSNGDFMVMYCSSVKSLLFEVLAQRHICSAMLDDSPRIMTSDNYHQCYSSHQRPVFSK